MVFFISTGRDQDTVTQIKIFPKFSNLPIQNLKSAEISQVSQVIANKKLFMDGLIQIIISTFYFIIVQNENVCQMIRGKSAKIKLFHR